MLKRILAGLIVAVMAGSAAVAGPSEEETARLAEQGDADAQTALGFMYIIGLGVPKNYSEAVRWFRLAAEQGNAGAQSGIGIMYRDGHGVPQDYAEAVRWFRLAAEQGDADAQVNLGSMAMAGACRRTSSSLTRGSTWRPLRVTK